MTPQPPQIKGKTEDAVVMERHPDGTLLRCSGGGFDGAEHRLIRYVEGFTDQGATLFVLMRPPRGPDYHMRASQLARWSVVEVKPRVDSREQGDKSHEPFIR